MTSKYDAMSDDELVAAYNKMAEEKGFFPVSRFSCKEVGIRRCEEMEQRSKQKGGGEEEKPPKKAKEPKVKKEKPPKQQKPAKANKVKVTLLDHFEARDGSIRKKLIMELIAHKGRQVPLRDLIKSCYTNAEEGKGAIIMVLKGVSMMIDKHKIPVVLRREKNDKKEVSYGLHDS